MLQQVEITETPTLVTEHRGLAYWCPHCRKVHYAPMPEAVVKAGLFGPRLTALVAFMKGVCHASFSTIRKFLRDVVRVDVCRGYLAKLIGKVSDSLAPAYAELFQRLPGEAVLNIDETGHKENGTEVLDLVFLRPGLHALPHRQVAGIEGADRGAGRGVQRSAGLRLLQRLPQVHAGVRRAGAVLHGPPDPRREVSADAART